MNQNMPPPPRPPTTNWLRLVGIIVACSAPVSGFLLYAIVATAAGEDRLEGDGGLTILGLMMFVIPVVVGLGLIAYSFTDRSGPDRRTVGFAVGGIGALLFCFGLWSLISANDGDASIGGGLLILAAAILDVVAAFLLRPTGNRSAQRPRL